jgi:membrane protein required for colicin V production
MNYIDIGLCVPLIWGMYKGFMKGLIVEAATFISFGLGVWGGIYFSEFCAEKIKELFNWNSPYLPIVSFAITFLGIIITIYVIAKLIQRGVEGMALGPVNKIGGALFGILKFALVMSVVIFVIEAIEKSYPLVSFQTKKESVLYKPVGMIAPLLIPGLKNSKVNGFIPTTENVKVKVQME